METEIIEDINPEDIEEEKELLFSNCRKVLDAGIWLMRNGYGRMMILPYVSPSGSYWRCEFHVLGMPQESLFRYSSASEGKYLNDHCGKRLRSSISPKGLARAILRNTSHSLIEKCEGVPSQDIEAWLIQLERYMEMQWIPAAFSSEKEPSRSKWNLVGMFGAPDSWIDAPPGYVIP